MISNGMWFVFSLSDLHNNDYKWDNILHQYISPFKYMKRHVNILQKVSKVYQYVVQNLTCSGLYLKINLSNALLHKVLTLVLLTATGPGIYVATMTTFIFDSYDYL